MKERMRLAAGAVCVSLALLLVGCEDGGGSSNDPSTPVTGNWSVNLNYEGSLSGTMTVNGAITDTDGQLSGMVSGSHNGESVSFTGSLPARTYDCAGTYDGDVMSGTCTVSANGASGSGTFTATRQ